MAKNVLEQMIELVVTDYPNRDILFKKSYNEETGQDVFLVIAQDPQTDERTEIGMVLIDLIEKTPRFH